MRSMKKTRTTSEPGRAPSALAARAAPASGPDPATPQRATGLAGRDPIDTITIAFGLVLALGIGIRRGDAALASGLVLANIVLALCARMAFPRLRAGRGAARFFGVALPFLVFYVLYRELVLVLGWPDTRFFDAVVAGPEWALWALTNPLAGPPWLGEVLAAAYMAYVPLLLVVVAVLGARAACGPAAPAEALARRICASWAVCYLVFLVVPVVGPRYVFPALQASRLGPGPFSALAIFNQYQGMLRGAAFPSAHVAATTVTVWSAWRWWPRGFRVVLPVALALVAGAVYLGYHWLVDVAGGVLVGALVVAADARIVRSADARTDAASPGDPAAQPPVASASASHGGVRP